MNTIPKATTAERFFSRVHYSHIAARILEQYPKKQANLNFSKIYKILFLLILGLSNIHADDLKIVPQQAEVIEHESEKKELPNGKLEVSISIDNEFTSSITKDISNLQDKLKNSAKETVNDSMKAIGKGIKSSITDIVKEAVGSMPKPEPTVVAPTPAQVPAQVPAPTPEPKIIVNNLVLAKSIAKKQNKKLIICLGNSFCTASQDVITALREQYIINTGDEYIVSILDMLYGREQLLVWTREYDKISGRLFPPGRSGIWHPAMVIENSKEEVLFAKRYDQKQYTSQRIVCMMKDDIDRYRNK